MKEGSDPADYGLILVDPEKDRAIGDFGSHNSLHGDTHIGKMLMDKIQEYDPLQYIIGDVNTRLTPEEREAATNYYSKVVRLFSELLEALKSTEYSLAGNTLGAFRQAWYTDHTTTCDPNACLSKMDIDREIYAKPAFKDELFTTHYNKLITLNAQNSDLLGKDTENTRKVLFRCIQRFVELSFPEATIKKANWRTGEYAITFNSPKLESHFTSNTYENEWKTFEQIDYEEGPNQCGLYVYTDSDRTYIRMENISILNIHKVTEYLVKMFNHCNT